MKKKVLDVNGKLYAISDSMDIKIQSSVDDVQVYGWTLEFRWKQNGGWTNWITYFNKRIYQSRYSALEASIKIQESHKGDCECRIAPLYMMSKPQFRQYKIDELLSEKNLTQIISEDIKAWKVIEDEEVFVNNQKVKVKKGDIFIKPYPYSIIKAANYSEPTKYHQEYLLRNYLIPKGKVVEIDIREEKWIQPHLCKYLKNKLKNK